MHFELLARHGGLRGLKDENALELALARPRNKWSYDPKTDLRESVARTALWFRERGLLPAPHVRPGYIRAPWTKH